MGQLHQKETYLLYVFLSCPCEGTWVVVAEDEDRVVIRVRVRGVQHGEEEVFLSPGERICQIQQHPSCAVSLESDGGK